MKYTISRTEIADACVRKIILYISENFGKDVALKKIEKLEAQIVLLENNPYLGIEPKDLILKRQGYRVLTVSKNLIFYKIDEYQKSIIIHAVLDQRQDYLNILRGL